MKWLIDWSIDWLITCAPLVSVTRVKFDHDLFDDDMRNKEQPWNRGRDTLNLSPVGGCVRVAVGVSWVRSVDGHWVLINEWDGLKRKERETEKKNRKRWGVLLWYSKDCDAFSTTNEPSGLFSERRPWGQLDLRTEVIQKHNILSSPKHCGHFCKVEATFRHQDKHANFCFCSISSP